MLYSSFSEAKSNPEIAAKYYSMWQVPSPYKNEVEEYFLQDCLHRLTDAAEEFDFNKLLNIGADCYEQAPNQEQKNYIFQIEQICIDLLIMMGVSVPVD